jgi:hypothetical protein
MLSATGIIAINDEPKEVVATGGAYFDFQGVAPDNYQGSKKYHYYKVHLYVPTKCLAEAREKLQVKKILHVHAGYWVASKYTYEGKETIGHQLQVSWNGVAIIGWFGQRAESPKTEQK